MAVMTPIAEADSDLTPSSASNSSDGSTVEKPVAAIAISPLTKSIIDGDINETRRLLQVIFFVQNG